MKTILKSENLGNTFIGLVCTAFNVRCQSVKLDHSMQFHGCGTIEVNGKAYDWFDEGDSVKFLEVM